VASERERELQLKRERLLVRSAELRWAMGRQAQALATPLAIADQVQAGVGWLRRNPEWPLGALVVLVVLRPQRALRWAGRAWWSWRLWRKAARLWTVLAAAPPRQGT
jgi:hypothetical protein